MIIGVDISSVNQKETGTKRYVDCLIKELNAFNHEIKFASSKEKLKINGKKFLQPERLRRLYYKHFKLGADLLNKNTDCAVFPNYFIAPGYNKPSVIVIHDLSFITHGHFYSRAFVKYYKHELKRTLELKPIIITVSRNSKSEIIKHTNAAEDKIHIVQGYSEFRRTNCAENKNENYFLYTGHIEPRKNLNFLIENFIKWRENGNHKINLKLAGEFWITDKEIKNLLGKYKDDPRIRFLGYVPEIKLKELYENASAFVHTSFVEGFGFPVLEAMHYGLPVLCSQGTAAEEISSPYSVRINPYDAGSLVSGFDRILELAAGQEYMHYNIPFSPALMKEQLEPVIEKLESLVSKKYFVKVWKAETYEKAVIKTLLYASLFNSGIKLNNLKKNIFDIKITVEQLNAALSSLYIKDIIIIKEDMVFINRSGNGFYTKKGNGITKTKLKIILKILAYLPFTTMVSFSGGTAHYGLQNHNDVDVFIVAKPHSVFIVYMFIHFFSFLFRVRNELCANYLLDENSVSFIENDLYTAHQIISLKPFRNSGYLNYFFSVNKWAKNYFPNFEVKESIYSRSSSFYTFLKPANKIIKNIYRFFYKTKLKKSINNSIVLEDGVIKLHTNDHRIKTLKEFERVLQNYKWESIEATFTGETEVIKEKILTGAV